ncbi:hypothetical protein V8C37DRAFT_371990 [Trichoderma ceciliae]
MFPVFWVPLMVNPCVTQKSFPMTLTKSTAKTISCFGFSSSTACPTHHISSPPSIVFQDHSHSLRQSHHLHDTA